MRYIKKTFTDELSLSFVKEHLNVTFSEDDVLIGNYINASLLFVEKGCNRILRPLEYIIEDDEKEAINISEGEFFELHLLKRPYEVIVDGTSYTELDNFYVYNLQYGLLYVPYTPETVTITANCGSSNTSLQEIELINQARLLLIGNWYSYRESDIIGSIKEVPNGVGRIMDILAGPSI